MTHNSTRAWDRDLDLAMTFLAVAGFTELSKNFSTSTSLITRMMVSLLKERPREPCDLTNYTARWIGSTCDEATDE